MDPFDAYFGLDSNQKRKSLQQPLRDMMLPLNSEPQFNEGFNDSESKSVKMNSVPSALHLPKPFDNLTPLTTNLRNSAHHFGDSVDNGYNPPLISTPYAMDVISARDAVVNSSMTPPVQFPSGKKQPVDDELGFNPAMGGPIPGQQQFDPFASFDARMSGKIMGSEVSPSTCSAYLVPVMPNEDDATRTVYESPSGKDAKSDSDPSGQASSAVGGEIDGEGSSTLSTPMVRFDAQSMRVRGRIYVRAHAFLVKRWRARYGELDITEGVLQLWSSQAARLKGSAPERSVHIDGGLLRLGPMKTALGSAVVFADATPLFSLSGEVLKDRQKSGRFGVQVYKTEIADRIYFRHLMVTPGTSSAASTPRSSQAGNQSVRTKSNVGAAREVKLLKFGAETLSDYELWSRALRMAAEAAHERQARARVDSRALGARMSSAEIVRFLNKRNGSAPSIKDPFEVVAALPPGTAAQKDDSLLAHRVANTFGTLQELHTSRMASRFSQQLSIKDINGIDEAEGAGVMEVQLPDGSQRRLRVRMDASVVSACVLLREELNIHNDADFSLFLPSGEASVPTCVPDILTVGEAIRMAGPGLLRYRRRCYIPRRQGAHAATSKSADTGATGPAAAQPVLELNNTDQVVDSDPVAAPNPPLDNILAGGGRMESLNDAPIAGVDGPMDPQPLLQAAPTTAKDVDAEALACVSLENGALAALFHEALEHIKEGHYHLPLPLLLDALGLAIVAVAVLPQKCVPTREECEKLKGYNMNAINGEVIPQGISDPLRALLCCSDASFAVRAAELMPSWLRLPKLSAILSSNPSLGGIMSLLRQRASLFVLQPHAARAAVRRGVFFGDLSSRSMGLSPLALSASLDAASSLESDFDPAAAVSTQLQPVQAAKMLLLLLSALPEYGGSFFAGELARYEGHECVNESIQNTPGFCYLVPPAESHCSDHRAAEKGGRQMWAQAFPWLSNCSTTTGLARLSDAQMTKVLLCTSRAGVLLRPHPGSQLAQQNFAAHAQTLADRAHALQAGSAACDEDLLNYSISFARCAPARGASLFAWQPCPIQQIELWGVKKSRPIFTLKCREFGGLTLYEIRSEAYREIAAALHMVVFALLAVREGRPAPTRRNREMLEKVFRGTEVSGLPKEGIKSVENGWTEIVDPATGSTAFWNIHTKETVFQLPS